MEIFARLIFRAQPRKMNFTVMFLLSRTTSLHTFWHNICAVLFSRLTILPRNAQKFPPREISTFTVIHLYWFLFNIYLFIDLFLYLTIIYYLYLFIHSFVHFVCTYVCLCYIEWRWDVVWTDHQHPRACDGHVPGPRLTVYSGWSAQCHQVIYQNSAYLVTILR